MEAMASPHRHHSPDQGETMTCAALAVLRDGNIAQGRSRDARGLSCRPRSARRWRFSAEPPLQSGDAVSVVGVPGLGGKRTP